jgi:hypothetical protein
MSISFEGIGQWAATFGCDGDVTEGQVVKISGNGAVSACASGDAFCGVAVSVGRDGGACSVVLGGLVTVPYTGTAPGLGWVKLAADGNGGVSAGQGRERLAVDVDTAGQTVTFAL